MSYNLFFTTPNRFSIGENSGVLLGVNSIYVEESCMILII